MKKVKYDYPNFNPLKLHPLNIDRIALDNIPNRSRVLDVGCATGFMGEYLKKAKDCFVVGVEKNKAEATQAKKKLDKVIILDIEKDHSTDTILKISKNKKFDIILAASIIEHLADPSSVLARLKSLLKPNGQLIITTPNIAHWSMRISLLKGNFNYEEYGILDKTHLHFYTKKTFPKLLKQSGFAVKALYIDPVGGGYPKISSVLSKILPGLFAYQFLIVAKPK